MSQEDNVSEGLSACKSTQAGDRLWAHFRFSVVGPLLASPPGSGQLQGALKRLALKRWRHPISGQWTRFGASTIERWYYKALKSSADPLGSLSRKIRSDQGANRSLSQQQRSLLGAQYKAHPDWSYQLHSDNLRVEAATLCASDPMPTYESVRRYMKAHGMRKRKRLGGKRRTRGTEAAEERFAQREVRSYESEYVNALWHLDFHHGSVRVLSSHGEWVYPILLGILDDHSRLCCHLQWYWDETAQTLIHGLCQAFMKRGLPRALMSDNGSAMVAHETTQGLLRLAIHHERTLPYSPYQNGKQESFWGSVEGRLLSMLDGSMELRMRELNEATQAWVEMEYNRKTHSQTACTPLSRFIESKDIGRACPSSELLDQAFTTARSRTQRRSDGTVSIEGMRYEIPSRYGHLEKLTVRYASWRLSHVYLCEARSDQILCRIYPQDKHKNADARRRKRQSASAPLAPESAPVGGQMAPLLRKLIADYAATGLPPAYLPKDENNKQQGQET